MSAAPNMVAVDAKPMMKALCFSAHGKPAVSVLSMMDVPRPVTAPAGCVLVKVMAAALNPIDAIRVEGGLKLLRKEAAFPAVLGYDLAGVIESVGEGVTGFSVGDEIAARMQNEPHPGSIAEFALVEARTLAKKPNGVSFTDAASIGLAGETALQALRKVAVEEGSKVFISGGAGGVGTLGIQIAKLLGASTVATTASPGDKTELCKSLGADVVVNYREQNFEEVLSGYDAAFDTTKEGAKCIKIVKPKTGKCVRIVGPPTYDAVCESAIGNGKEPPGAMVKCVLGMLKDRKTFNEAAAAGVDYNHMFLIPSGADLKTLLSWMDEGKLKPIIDSIHPLPDALEAAKRNFSGRARGKVVVSMSV